MGCKRKATKLVSAKLRFCPFPGAHTRTPRSAGPIAPRQPLTWVRQSGEYMTAAGGCGLEVCVCGERGRERGGEREREREREEGKKRERERGEEGEPRACFLLSHFQLCQTAASAEPLHELNFNPASTFPHYALGMPALRAVKGIAHAARPSADPPFRAPPRRSAPRRPAQRCSAPPARGGGEGRGGGCGATASLRPAAPQRGQPRRASGGGLKVFSFAGFCVCYFLLFFFFLFSWRLRLRSALGRGGSGGVGDGGSGAAFTTFPIPFGTCHFKSSALWSGLLIPLKNNNKKTQ